LGDFAFALGHIMHLRSRSKIKSLLTSPITRRPRSTPSYFFDWCADHEHHDFPDFMKRYWPEADEPFAWSRARIARELPQHMEGLDGIVLRIQRESFEAE
jgi:hypothetical protein